MTKTFLYYGGPLCLPRGKFLLRQAQLPPKQLVFTATSLHACWFELSKVSRARSGHRPWSLPRLQAGAGNIIELMWPYDLVIVEEVGQLSKANFERIMEQWIAADRLPTLVFVGDFFQLPGVDPTSALDSWMWHNVMVKKRESSGKMEPRCKISCLTNRKAPLNHKAKE